MNIDSIISSTITRSTPVASLPGFGVPAILAQFATSKTTTPFTRARFYASTAELVADGWAATDSVYLAAAAIFAQSPTVERIMVGRIDSGDASVAAAGDAIQAEQQDWYTFDVVGNRSVTLTLSADLITGNVIASTINGITVGSVTYATSHANTMALWKTAIEAAVTGATATVNGRAITVTKVGTDYTAATATVTGGASQPTTAVTYALEATKTKAWMAWAETQVKIFGFHDTDAATLAVGTGNSGTAGLVEYAKLMSYKRTVGIYHANPGEYIWSAWCGSELAQDVGVRLWAFRNLAGISADTLTTSQISYIAAKNGNSYTVTATYSHMYAGLVAAGTQIDQTRGLDYLNSQIKTAMFNLLVQTKVTISDVGRSLIENALSSTLKVHGEQTTILETGSTSVTVPLPSAVPPADRAAGIYSGIKWTGTLLIGALRVEIAGTVTV